MVCTLKSKIKGLKLTLRSASTMHLPNTHREFAKLKYLEVHGFILTYTIECIWQSEILGTDIYQFNPSVLV